MREGTKPVISEDLWNLEGKIYRNSHIGAYNKTFDKKKVKNKILKVATKN